MADHPKVMLRQEVTETYSGPYPDPVSLKQYEDIKPGFADRLITMAEREQMERLSSQKALIKVEQDLAEKEIMNLKRGQWFALVSALLVIGLCAYAFHLGFAAEARDIAVVVIVGLAGIFIVRRFTKKSEASSAK